jgi:hypothetical protein
LCHAFKKSFSKHLTIIPLKNVREAPCFPLKNVATDTQMFGGLGCGADAI